MSDDESAESEDDFGHLGVDIRHGHRMCDVFDCAGLGTSLVDRFTGALKDILFIMKFSSPVIADFFGDVTECLIKRKVRQFLKLLTAFWCVILIKSLRYPEPSLTNLTFSIAILMTVIVLYLCTFRDLSRTEYMLISITSTILSLVYTVYESCRRRSAMDGAFAYPFSLVIMLLVFLPIHVRITIPLILLFCTLFVTTSSRKMTFAQLKRDIYANTLYPLKSQLDAYRFSIIRHGMVIWANNQANYLMTQIICWVIVIFIGCYLRFWIELRRRSAFSIIGKSVKARKRCQRALKNQSDWITAIMPIQVRDAYMQMRLENIGSGKIWVYSTAFPEVSILFADIVGFTKMSSSKTATKIVMLLNDLYNRFDDLSNKVNCEKIGTLGDCYYAVAGCPVERSDHAACCVELGLGMCRIIKVFNQDNGEEVNMRVGIHTGRVNAAIIGNSRFRYDVYSSDVIIANQMETYGLPGRVHISRPTYKLVKTIYRFARGEPLTIQREEAFGLAGLEKKDVKLKTYFVDPLSSKVRRHNETYGKDQGATRILTLNAGFVEGSTASDSMLRNSLSDLDTMDIISSSSFGHPSKFSGKMTRESSLFFGTGIQQKIKAENWRRTNKRDIRLIEDLQDDPQEQVGLFRSMPLTPLLHRFKDAQVERDFKEYMEGFVPIVTVESPKLSSILDAAVISIINFLLTFPSLMICATEVDGGLMTQIMIAVVVLTTTGLCSILLIWGSTLHSSSEQSGLRTRMYLFLSKSLVREVLLAALTTAPVCIRLLLTDIQAIKTTRESSKRVIHFELSMLGLLVHSMATASFSWTRALCIVVTGLLMWLELKTFKAAFDHTFCESMLWYHNLDTPVEGFNERIASMCTLMAVAYFITVENEWSLRLWYFVSREAAISVNQAIAENESAQQLLDNVIPRYIFEQLARRGYTHLKAGTFCFATSIPGAAVSFACLTNFFSAYYREDYKGGEGSLKLLNTIICSFDALMAQPEFNTVEKIKTINDCYMIAAGLNMLQRETDPSGRKHVLELMEYCFGLYRTLDDINDKYIIGTDKFLMKVGYYVGDVTAGIIGSRKPIYDIWGNTVNVASRMYSTGYKGKIQVPEEVKLMLEDSYDFEYRGTVFVKGKGDMQTYFCHQKANGPATG
ncbi:unnamed protein product [Schistocephalus solidus]|uniref:adenylate cyclase n=1 Tax=Schistocephalus solidus TaxID=70667 RepID=A0A183SLL9_SCHSO|nr:unnamed protein product [Schistocephalus solidus]